MRSKVPLFFNKSAITLTGKRMEWQELAVEIKHRDTDKCEWISLKMLSYTPSGLCRVNRKEAEILIKAAVYESWK